jgi:hypothetical protein
VKLQAGRLRYLYGAPMALNSSVTRVFLIAGKEKLA